jgi:hypothetical protein
LKTTEIEGSIAARAVAAHNNGIPPESLPKQQKMEARWKQAPSS